MRGWTATLVLALLVCGASAFQLGDHTTITGQALDEFEACFPGVFDAEWANTIVAGNLAEDINLWNKWVRGFSHFYSPLRQVVVKKFGITRYNADVRVKDLTGMLEQYAAEGSHSQLDWSAIYKRLGQAIHYMQDMASPPHVVPVMHGLTDGFEGFGHREFAEPADCTFFDSLKDDSALDIMRDAALETLNYIASQVEYTSDQETGPQRMTLSEAFWTDSALDSEHFGQYGAMGNNFGVTDFYATINGKYSSIHIEQSEYRRIKEARLRAAVDATKRLFNWLRLRLPARQFTLAVNSPAGAN